MAESASISEVLNRMNCMTGLKISADNQLIKILNPVDYLIHDMQNVEREEGSLLVMTPLRDFLFTSFSRT